MSYRYDLHLHTDASPCSNMSPDRVVEAATDADLDGIAITDHDTVENVDAVRDTAPTDLDVITGVEVTTTEGHLLALDVTEAPPKTNPMTVIDHVHEQGGVAVLSHPFDTLRQHYITDLEAIAEAVDAVEAVNSRCVRETFNRRAGSFADCHSLPRTGGSDAHFPMEIGRACTASEKPVLEAIQDGSTRPSGRGRYLSGHVATKFHQFRQVVL